MEQTELQFKAAAITNQIGEEDANFKNLISISDGMSVTVGFVIREK